MAQQPQIRNFADNYRYPKPECTGGIVNASAFFCECDYFREMLDNWVPLSEKIHPAGRLSTNRVKALEFKIGKLEEKDGKLEGDRASDRWIQFNVDMTNYWDSYHYNPHGKRLQPGSSDERSVLTDRLPIIEPPYKRLEADWGDWPNEKADFNNFTEPVSNGKVTCMMARYMTSALEAGIQPMNLNMRVGVVLPSNPN